MKYRIWDIEHNVFSQYKLVSQNGEVLSFNGLRPRHQENYIIQQCTELKDKNCVEIYDGDLVKLDFFEPYSNEAVSCDEDKEVIGMVKFYAGGWFIDEPDSIWYQLYDVIDYAKIEIIGNAVFGGAR